MTREEKLEYHRRYYRKNRKRWREYGAKWREQNPQYSRMYSRFWRLNNIEKSREAGRRFYHKHREAIRKRLSTPESILKRRIYLRNYYRVNRERMKQVRHAHYQKNKAKIIERTRAYAKANPDIIKKSQMNWLRRHRADKAIYARRYRAKQAETRRMRTMALAIMQSNPAIYEVFKQEVLRYET